jgi:haloalkane dehalogenase
VTTELRDAPHTDAARIARARSVVAPFRAEYPFEPHFLRLESGASLHYLDEGGGRADAAASPLLCLHGNPTWSFFYRGLAKGLRSRHRVVAPDHVGCGLSDKPADYPYRLEQHARNVEALVLALDLSNITLVVHDWGGAIGMGFARRHPERIARLVVMNTAAFHSTRIPLRISVCRWPLLGPLAVRGFGAFSRAALAMAVEGELSRDVRRAYLAPHADWSARVATLAFVRDIPLHPGHPSWDELSRIDGALELFRDRPVCILWGERDWCFTPAFRAEWERRFPGAEVHAVADAGHWILEDAGDRALAWIRAFIEGDGRGA